MTREEWEAKQNSLKKEYKYVPTGNPGEVNKVENVNKDGDPDIEKIKSDWNGFLRWLDNKKLRGIPELDTQNKGNNLFNQYIKENPNTSLSVKTIPLVRQAYMDLRDSALKDISEGKAAYEGTPESFMRHIVLNEQTANPNYVGQHLTQTYFPGAKVDTYQNNKLIDTKKIDILK